MILECLHQKQSNLYLSLFYTWTTEQTYIPCLSVGPSTLESYIDTDCPASNHTGLAVATKMAVRFLLL